MTALQELVIQKRQQFLRRIEESQPDEKNWEQRVQELYQQLLAWLKSLVDSGLVKLEWQSVPAGRWTVDTVAGETRYFVEKHQNSLIVKFFNGKTIKFVPIGFNIIGAYGRIDMHLGLRNVMIVMKEKDGKWFFTERHGLAKAPLYEFTQTHFERLVMEFVEGF